MPRCVVVVGLQWGDEGKGKVVDLLGAEAQVVVRYQGGANAGHTIVVSGQKIVLHQIPSGILTPEVLCVVGPAVVLDPETLVEEMKSLTAAGYEVTPARLAISRSANLVLSYHKELDRLRERGPGRIGTTCRGIGPAYEDMVARRGVRIFDLCDADRLRSRLREVLPERNALILHLGGSPVSLDELVERLMSFRQVLEPFLADTRALLWERFCKGERVLFESAQGTLLDVLYGTYPFVTSSLTTAMAAFALTGVPMPSDAAVVGVMKAYTTRVGAGPFPTEHDGQMGEYLRTRGKEYGATTGRPRRCGALDLPSLRYAAQLNGVSHLALMKLDVLSGLEEIPVCVAYRRANQVVETVEPSQLGELQPVFEMWPGWTQDLVGRSEKELPENARAFVERVSRAIGAPVAIVSLGSDRKDTILRFNIWS